MSALCRLMARRARAGRVLRVRRAAGRTGAGKCGKGACRSRIAPIAHCADRAHVRAGEDGGIRDGGVVKEVAITAVGRAVGMDGDSPAATNGCLPGGTGTRVAQRADGRWALTRVY